MQSIFKDEQPIIDYLMQNIKNLSKTKLSISVFLIYQGYLKQYSNQLLYPNVLFPGTFKLINGIPETKLTKQYTKNAKPKQKYSKYMNYKGFTNQIDNQNINTFMRNCIKQLQVVNDHGMLYRLSFETYLKQHSKINAQLMQKYI